MSRTTSQVLHGLRRLGFGTSEQVAARAGLGVDDTHEELLDQQARGRVTWSEFGAVGGWSLTESGRAANERMLRDELDTVPGGRALVAGAYDDFLPLNAELQQACTDWQLYPTATHPLAANDHTDAAWDGRVLARLGAVAHGLERLEASLVAVLPRFAGYHARFTGALAAGRVDDQDDSCHRIWFELHEDLLATLGLSR